MFLLGSNAIATIVSYKKMIPIIAKCQNMGGCQVDGLVILPFMKRVRIKQFLNTTVHYVGSFKIIGGK